MIASLGPQDYPAADFRGRSIRKLRVSLTDACNYRCFYCMEENPAFTPPANLLSPGEIESICRRLAFLGLREIRLTGGEPTLRPEFLEIAERLSLLPIHSLAVTSNGHFLRKHLVPLKSTRLRKINVSVDSLDGGRFHTITRGGDLRRVLGSLLAARDLGFQVKVNAVMLRGINEDELPDFVRFSEAEGVELRFLEYMKVGPRLCDFDRHFIPAREMRAHIEESAGALQPVDMPRDSTARVFATPRGGRLGFIASESEPFCGDCSRLRLSATGILRPCLMMNEGISLRGAKPEEIPDRVARVVARKPTGRLAEIGQGMYQIGG